MNVRMLIYGFSILCFACENKKSEERKNNEELIEKPLLEAQSDPAVSKSIEDREFVTIFESEYIVSPDSTILAYNTFIKKYPDSDLNEKVEIRIKQINKDKKYWQKDSGWKISKDGLWKKPTVAPDIEKCK